MLLLIDGYNLLHATGIAGRGSGPGGFERSRLALLNFLAASIDPVELMHTTVVFDAREAPWGLPRIVEHGGIAVRFAAKYESADDLIIELIQAASAPRRLVVVSSDHVIQRAARRRRAKAVDSDLWYAELIRARRERTEAVADAPARPAVPLLAEDVNYWLRQFGGESALSEFLASESSGQPAVAENRPDDQPDDEKPSPSEAGPLDNPFPPGYGDDLLRDL
jgi:predicted RNA-binding protein with PIN domain